MIIIENIGLWPASDSVIPNWGVRNLKLFYALRKSVLSE